MISDRKKKWSFFQVVGWRRLFIRLIIGNLENK